MEKKVYHYTKGLHLLKIISDEIIKFSGITAIAGELPYVALSTNDNFENSILPLKPKNGTKVILSGKIKMNDIPEYNKVDDILEASKIVQGFYRFEINNQLPFYNWYEYKRFCSEKGRINSKYFASIEKYLENSDSLSNSLFSMTPIPKKDWIEVEVFNVDTKKWEIFTRESFMNMRANFKPIKLYGLIPHFSSFDIYKDNMCLFRPKVTRCFAQRLPL